MFKRSTMGVRRLNSADLGLRSRPLAKSGMPLRLMLMPKLRASNTKRKKLHLLLNRRLRPHRRHGMWKSLQRRLRQVQPRLRRLPLLRRSRKSRMR